MITKSHVCTSTLELPQSECLETKRYSSYDEKNRDRLPKNARGDALGEDCAYGGTNYDGRGQRKSYRKIYLVQQQVSGCREDTYGKLNNVTKTYRLFGIHSQGNQPRHQYQRPSGSSDG